MLGHIILKLRSNTTRSTKSNKSFVTKRPLPQLSLRFLCATVSAARLVHFFYPSHVELHNYERAPSSLVRRRANWETLNRKVLWKFELQLSDSSIDELALGKMGAVDVLLLRLMQRIRQLQMQMRQPPTTRRQKWLHQ